MRLRATALTAAALAASVCCSGFTTGPGGGGPADAAPPGQAPAAALSSFYGQKLRWHGCEGQAGFECARLKAPLDYAKPATGVVRLAVARKKATGPGARIGSLLVNPGGPGGSAVDFLTGYAGLDYPKRVRARYDMVAMDPRGVARSAPVTCLDGAGMDRWTSTDVTPDDPAETDALIRSFRAFAQGCEQRSPRVLGHVSTVDSARDMDLLRSALGDRELHYVGASYGTFLGATYAGLFPGRAGRLVLDGAMDPALDAYRMNLDQTAGFETAFQSFARDCVARAGCPLGRSGTGEAGRRLKAFFARVDHAPVPTSDGDRVLGEPQATTGVIAAMYSQAAWPALREALKSAMNEGDGTTLLSMSDAYYERDGKGTYSNLMAANTAVNCLDLPPAFTGPAAVRKALPAFEKASPVFGEGMAWTALNCAYWPLPATGTAHRITAKGAAPIVVVGTTRDPATPYGWARSLAAQLSSGTLLTYEGDGHTAYGRGSTCVDTAINTYLLTGTPPKRDKWCA